MLSSLTISIYERYILVIYNNILAITLQYVVPADKVMELSLTLYRLLRTRHCWIMG